MTRTVTIVLGTLFDGNTRRLARGLAESNRALTRADWFQSRPHALLFRECVAAATQLCKTLLSLSSNLISHFSDSYEQLGFNKLYRGRRPISLGFRSALSPSAPKSMETGIIAGSASRLGASRHRVQYPYNVRIGKFVEPKRTSSGLLARTPKSPKCYQVLTPTCDLNRIA